MRGRQGEPPCGRERKGKGGRASINRGAPGAARKAGGTPEECVLSRKVSTRDEQRTNNIVQEEQVRGRGPPRAVQRIWWDLLACGGAPCCGGAAWERLHAFKGRRAGRGHKRDEGSGGGQGGTERTKGKSNGAGAAGSCGLGRCVCCVVAKGMGGGAAAGGGGAASRDLCDQGGLPLSLAPFLPTYPGDETGRGRDVRGRRSSVLALGKRAKGAARPPLRRL